jgi:leader peptidase (prepilin peptidase)/N-methyltransferase
LIDGVPHWLLILCLSGLGLIAGSFLGLVSVRLPTGQGIVAGRSRCTACSRTLSSRDLIPMLSYLVARGKCRLCKARIPICYPAMELGCAALGAWAALIQPTPLAALLTALLGWQLLLIAVVDAEHFWLPDGVTLPLMGSGLAASALLKAPGVAASLTGTVVGFVSLWLLAWAYRQLRGREGLGGGDPYLFAAIGAWVGWAGLPSVLLWAAAAGLSVVLAAQLGRRGLTGSSRLPFGVFLAIGGWFTWNYGPLGL